MMLSKSVFVCAFRGQTSHENPKISLKIFNLKAFLLFYSWAKLSRISSKKQREIDPWILEKNHK